MAKYRDPRPGRGNRWITAETTKRVVADAGRALKRARADEDRAFEKVQGASGRWREYWKEKLIGAQRRQERAQGIIGKVEAQISARQAREDYYEDYDDGAYAEEWEFGGMYE